MKKIILIIYTSLIIMGCSPQNIEFILDNPTDTAFKTKINDKEYILNAGTYEKISLNPGKQELTDINGKKHTFIVYADSLGGIINPSKSDYIYATIVYAIEGEEDSFGTTEKQIVLNGMKYKGPFDITNNLIIDKNLRKWKFDIHVPLPETIRVYNEKGNIFTKVFTLNEFSSYIRENGIEGIPTEEKNTESIQVISTEFADNVSLLEDSDLKKHLENLIALDNAYGIADQPKEQKRIMSEYKDAWKNYVQYSMENKELIERSPTAKFNYLGRGVLILDE